MVRIDVTMYQRSPTYVITVKTVKEAFMKEKVRPADQTVFLSTDY